MSAALSKLTPDTLCHYRMVATNALGTVHGADATFSIGPDPDRDKDGLARPQDCNDDDPRVFPGAREVPDNGIDEDCSQGDSVDFDRDRDGANRPQDCNDADPAIGPGAADVPGNTVDENCDERDAEFSVIATTITLFFQSRGARTRVTELTLGNVPASGRVVVTCKTPKGCRRACPFRRFSRTYRAAKRRVVLVRRFKGRRLPPGTVLEVRVLAPLTIGKVVRYTIGRGAGPRRQALCLVPGASTPSRCP